MLAVLLCFRGLLPLQPAFPSCILLPWEQCPCHAGTYASRPHPFALSGASLSHPLHPQTRLLHWLLPFHTDRFPTVFTVESSSSDVSGLACSSHTEHRTVTMDKLSGRVLLSKALHSLRPWPACILYSPLHSPCILPAPPLHPPASPCIPPASPRIPPASPLHPPYNNTLSHPFHCS